MFEEIMKNKETKNHLLHPKEKFCQKCFEEILNYYGIFDHEKILCVKCSKTGTYLSKVQPAFLYQPYTIRYPLILVSLLLSKNMIPSIDIPNKYEA